MARDSRDRTTLDLFDTVYPVRKPQAIDGIGFEVKLCRAIGEALKACGETREVIAAHMAEYLGEPSFSKAMLDAYASPARDAHCINVKRFMALIQVTRQTWLLDVLAEPFGCYVMESEEARMAELGLIERSLAELQDRKKALKRGDAVKIARRMNTMGRGVQA